MKRFAFNLAIIFAFIAFADGFIHRDPYVRLAHGYAIAAICWNCPCELNHSTFRDDRTYSDWLAMTTRDPDDQSVIYLLATQRDTLKFDNEDAWRAAVIEKRAQPGEIAARLQGVTGYRADQNHAIGKFEGGYFLLDQLSHDLLVTQSKDDWKDAVTARTSLNPNWLRNPKNPFVQTRLPFAVPTYLVLIGVALVMSWRECRRGPRIRKSARDEPKAGMRWAP